MADAQEDFPNSESRWVVLDPIAASVTQGIGTAPPSITADHDTGIVWDQVETNRYNVSVMHQGKTTKIELEPSIE